MSRNAFYYEAAENIRMFILKKQFRVRNPWSRVLCILSNNIVAVQNTWLNINSLLFFAVFYSTLVDKIKLNKKKCFKIDELVSLNKNSVSYI